ncbi:hypothetical protein CL6EHI_004050 [Entamoeba histolytica]|uniref:Uncharacterized protein n=2 Tax=Entamoeba histolytica TaxID=5759 RepID=B1N5C5_ENTH1|nr:hypothetical protein EHI_004050 [Entamoeba histolytica HM-1:IMSS]EDS88832.1 hypothetical protein EHI_004050 [Entamoeba histolytica HM-1:IMSS]GAT99414.1 hypothetical protein CL6EHI_004050 [Entamoeba histolytica]|eukprot:XP_001914391.1 hypothetical protein EHI_004050 [Entamoeba histolytica HM-1:IMSS]
MFIALLALTAFAAAENIYECTYSDSKLKVVTVYEDGKCYFENTSSKKVTYVPATDENTKAKIKIISYTTTDCSGDEPNEQLMDITKKADISSSTTGLVYLYNEEPDKMGDECSLINNQVYSDDQCTNVTSNMVRYSCNVSTKNCNKVSNTEFYMKSENKVGYFGTFYYKDENCTEELGFGSQMYKCGMCVPQSNGDKYVKYECEDECQNKPNDDGSIATIVAFIAIALFFVF